MRIGLDVMGGDYAPKAILEGAVLALDEIQQSSKIVLIGDKSAILRELELLNTSPERFDIVHADDVIGMDEKPIKAIASKKDSSMVMGFDLLKNKEIDSFASAGSTGAMLVGAIQSIGAIPGILRPCIATIFPKLDGNINLLLDVGTCPDAKPDVLSQFGLIGSAYAEKVLNIKNPKVGLLNIGEEEGKGNLQCIAAHKLMKENRDYDFIGNVESRELFGGECNVFVCDGFVGNIVLKHTEALWYNMYKRGLMDDYFRNFNYELYGGLPLLGVNGTVIIGHGISSKIAIKNMMLQSEKVYKANVSGYLAKHFEGLNTMKND